MPTLTLLRHVKRVVMPGVFIAALIATIGLQASGAAAQGQPTWSIVVHFQYQDGFEFDYVLERGVTTRDVPAYLADCGSSHRWGGDVVHYHCYPVPE
jgi:hypothetical protein